MASELRVNTLKDASGNNSIATSFVAGGSAKAWVNFKADDPSVRDSLNIASMTDGGNCNYTHNFTNSMGNDDYSPVGFVKDGSTNTFGRLYASIDGDTFSTSALQVRPSATNDSSFTTAFDPGYVCTQINGDLA